MYPQIGFRRGRFLRGFEHLHRGFIHLYHIIIEQLFAQQVDQTLDHQADPYHPLRQFGARQFNAEPLEDRLLAIQRQRILVNADDDKRQ